MPTRLKIYVIDDEMELCQDLRGWLVQAGHEVECSPAERTEIHTLLQYQPDLIVLGMTRYAGSGLGLCRRLNNHRQLRQVPMIVVSDDASLEYEMLDAFDFQVRPFDRKRLQICLERLSGSCKFLSGTPFPEPELTAVKSYLLQQSGLHFSRHNHRILERGLLRRIQALRMESLPAYLSYLMADSDNYDERNKLLGLLTIGETSFFRYRSHRDALLHEVLPRLIEQNSARGQLRIWSAGCSTGEEPYSLAILLLEHFPELMRWDVQILATDINKRALRQAREGIYGERSLRMVEPLLRERYFRKTGNLFALSAPVRRMVRFDYLNLQTDRFPKQETSGGGVDLLLCRNVLIYFELQTIRQIVEKFFQVLTPKGYLFMGHSETMQNVSDRFRRLHQHNAFYYQRKSSVVTSREAEGKVSPTSTPSAAVPAKTRDRSEGSTAGARHEPPAKVKGPALRDPEQLYREALAAFDHEHFVEAATLFDQLLDQQPKNPQALVGKGLLLANQGKYSDARICCARAIKENDLLPEAYLLRGLILDMEGFIDRALVEYQKVLWLDPAFVMAHYLSAKIHDRQADAEKKLRSLRNTVRALKQSVDQAMIPYSGGLTRGVFLEIVNRELADLPGP